uniref:AlNc14C106G6206 protein n=1 Tax=Albugo laibachii Nc14 TaxID=890382 RepID=F0WHZ9_9STRA|nr:AlNc14C106G6206 [Albugo laibachii Nc14]|eukprot:CCA20876.1 AlNc14C106G6206 [Albugo laibachii Nc14]
MCSGPRIAVQIQPKKQNVNRSNYSPLTERRGKTHARENAKILPWYLIPALYKPAFSGLHLRTHAYRLIFNSPTNNNIANEISLLVYRNSTQDSLFGCGGNRTEIKLWEFKHGIFPNYI